MNKITYKVVYCDSKQHVTLNTIFSRDTVPYDCGLSTLPQKQNGDVRSMNALVYLHRSLERAPCGFCNVIPHHAAFYAPD